MNGGQYSCAQARSPFSAVMIYFFVAIIFLIFFVVMIISAHLGHLNCRHSQRPDIHLHCTERDTEFKTFPAQKQRKRWRERTGKKTTKQTDEESEHRKISCFVSEQMRKSLRRTTGKAHQELDTQNDTPRNAQHCKLRTLDRGLNDDHSECHHTMSIPCHHTGFLV